MPVTTTVTDILDIAWSHSKKLQDGEVFQPTTEDLPVVHRAMSGLYGLAARVNPTYFGDEDDLAAVVGGWERPTAAELVYRLELLDGTWVRIVPFDQRDIAGPFYSVYEFGRVYKQASVPLPAPGPPPVPATPIAALHGFWSKRPAKPATLGAALDASWDEQYNELLGLEVAIYAALKDERPDAVWGALRAERDRWLALFIATLEHATVGLVHGAAPTFVGPSLVPLGALVAGGTSLGK